MNFRSTRGFANHFLLAALVTLGFGGSVGLGTVWLRHQISVVADTNRDLEQQRHDIERHTDDISAQVESALSPDVLRAQNQLMQLGLVELTQAQITPVPIDPISRLVARANRRVFERDGVSGGVSIRLDLPTETTASTSPVAPAGRQATRHGPLARSNSIATNP